VGNSVFAPIGRVPATAILLAVVCAALLIRSLREHVHGYFFAAGLAAALGVLLAQSCWFLAANRVLDEVLSLQLGIRLLQLLILACAAWAVFGIVLTRRLSPAPGAAAIESGPFAEPITIAVTGLALLGGLALFLLLFPARGGAIAWIEEIGSARGWLAFALTLMVGAIGVRRRQIAVPPRA